jgi:hypothetical protein
MITSEDIDDIIAQMEEVKIQVRALAKRYEGAVSLDSGNVARVHDAMCNFRPFPTASDAVVAIKSIRLVMGLDK